MSDPKQPSQPAETPSRRPKLDLQAALEKLKLPGVNTEALFDHGRKDIEALLAANERVFTGVEALTNKQAALLLEIMREWQAGAKDVIGKGSPSEKVNQVSQHAQHAFSHALANMKEMAEIAAKSHEDVLSILNQRYQENVEAFRKSLHKQLQGKQ
jgi:phasin family protein